MLVSVDGRLAFQVKLNQVWVYIILALINSKLNQTNNNLPVAIQNKIDISIISIGPSELLTRISGCTWDTPQYLSPI